MAINRLSFSFSNNSSSPDTTSHKEPSSSSRSSHETSYYPSFYCPCSSYHSSYSPSHSDYSYSNSSYPSYSHQNSYSSPPYYNYSGYPRSSNSRLKKITLGSFLGLIGSVLLSGAITITKICEQSCAKNGVKNWVNIDFNTAKSKYLLIGSLIGAGLGYLFSKKNNNS